MKILSSTWKNVRRSPYQAIAAILIMTLTFLVVSLFIYILFGSSKVISYFESKPQVTAFFKDDAKQEDVNSLASALKDNSKVATLKFVSKDEALKIYREQNKNDPLLLDLVTADILPASLEISTYKIEDLSNVATTLNASKAVQEVIYQKDIVSTLTSWTTALRRIGIVSIIVLSLVSIFIMITIIGIKVSQKRDDIEIMRLVGASNWYISWPFIFEGIFYGLIGSIIGWTISLIGLFYFKPFLINFLKGIPLFPIPVVFFVFMIGFEFLLATFLGTLSSYLAVLRYLKKS